MFVIYNAILRRYPADIYKVYETADNTFPTTIFILVSAIQKLSRCMNIPAGTLLYRGLGGSMELPDTFFVPSQKCITPNALGYCVHLRVFSVSGRERVPDRAVLVCSKRWQAANRNH